MWVAILELAGVALVPLIKWIFEKIAKKKLNDKEFVAYISAHQKKRAMAGKASISWEEALKKAQDEMKADEEKPKEESKE